MKISEKYYGFLKDRLNNDLKNYELYYSELLESYWWINPTTKKWVFEFESSGTLWWNYEFGMDYMTRTGSEEEEFVFFIKDYITNILTNVINIKETFKLEGQPEGDVEKILEDSNG